MSVSHPPITSACLKFIFPFGNNIQSFITGILVDDPINTYYNFGNTKLQLQFNANINRLGKLFTSMFMLLSECEMLACQSYHLFNFGFPTWPSKKHEASDMDYLCLFLPSSCPWLKIAIMYWLLDGNGPGLVELKDFYNLLSPGNVRRYYCQRPEWNLVPAVSLTSWMIWGK